jgi:serine/threonine protein kinase
VLEWVPKGSLGGLLEDLALVLTWDEPLLRIATDVARGMVYLHGRNYYDEATKKNQNCVLHRDLKPDNCLVTDFLSAKISDFGTSRAKAGDDVTMTSVGTPLFCAPEVMRGDPYDEKVRGPLVMIRSKMTVRK